MIDIHLYTSRFDCFNNPNKYFIGRSIQVKRLSYIDDGQCLRGFSEPPSNSRYCEFTKESWLNRNSFSYACHILTSKNHFIKELNNLITVTNTFSNKQIDDLIINNPFYTKDMFIDKTINFTCYDVTLKEYCDLDQFGFKIKGFDHLKSNFI